MYVLTPNEYNLDLHIPKKKERLKNNFFPHMEKEDLSFIFENNRV